MRLFKFRAFNESRRIEMEIPKDIRDIHQLLRESGKKLYLVGGAVRDFLNKEEPKDFDLCTDAMPDEIISILRPKYRLNLQGKAFGVVVVHTKSNPQGYEIATFREDISKGRRPEVRLGATIETDVKRRDLTFNALFFDLDKNEIVDLVGGEKDLRDKITRMVGDPMERIEEDSLRILRAMRFSCRYDAPLDPKLSKSIMQRNKLSNLDPESGEYKRISQERIWDEIKKAFKQSKDFKKYLDMITYHNMWEEVFPGVSINSDVIKTKYLTTYLAELFKYNNPSKLESILVNDFRIEYDISQKIVFLLRFKTLNSHNAFEMYKNFTRFRVSKEELMDWMELENLTGEDFQKFLVYKPSVSSQELMDMGYKGAELGQKIKELEKINFENL
jgi:poly(A) polymerase